MHQEVRNDVGHWARRGEGLVIRRENCSYFLSMRSGMAVVGMGMR